MKLTVSERVQRIKPSATLAISARAKALKAAGQDVINMGVGEPDFDTPDNIKQAGVAAIESGFTKYTPVDGTESLKKAVAAKFAQDNQLSYELNQILVSCGGKQSFYNLAQAFLNPGDEVVIPAPYWVSFPDMVLLAGAHPVYINGSFDQEYKITPTQLDSAITAKTRMVVLNSPSNPSGKVYTHQELHELGEVLLRHPNVLVVTDDMYEHILWTPEPFANIVMMCPQLYDRTMVLNGVSKAYSMTGWRIGYAAGPEPIISAMKKIQSQSTSNPCSIAQKAAEEALIGNQQPMRDMVSVFKKRHELINSLLAEIPGVKCHPSDGTFFVFPDISGAMEGFPDINNDVDFAEYLLNETGVAAVPGAAFGMPGCMRFSFAISEEMITEAMKRFKKMVG